MIPDALTAGAFAWLAVSVIAGVAVAAAMIRRERRRAAHQLSDAEAKFSAFMSHGPFSAWMRDRKGRLIYANDRARDVDRAESAGPSWREDLRVIESGRPSERIEHTGKGQHWLVLKFPIRSQGGEAMLGAVGLDLTARYEVDERLRASERKLRSVMQSASDGIAAADDQGRIISWNLAAERTFGYSEEQVLGQPLAMLVDEQSQAGLAQLPAEGQPQSLIGRRSGGETFALELSRSPWRSGGQQFVTAILRDVTERVRLEEARRSQEQAQLRAREAAALETSRLKSEFLAHMSHEIRTPISGVIGMAHHLAGTELSPDQRAYTDAIQSSAEALLAIINDILDFSKVEAGKLEVEEISFGLQRVLDEVERTVRHLAHQKGLRLELEVSPEIPAALRGDPVRVRQVLLNLVSNAIKFTERGGIILSVRPSPGTGTASGDSAAARVRFEVADSGAGIAPQALEKLFQPFSQADSSTSRRFGGTGLGLSISKRLVERMGGEIGVRSQLARGSVFWFDLPLGVAQAAREQATGPLPTPSATSSARDKTESPEAQRGRVLVAEDNAINQKIILTHLRKLGIPADAVANGNEALAALAKVQYDLVLMDCQMPGMDGYEATARIRAEQGSWYQSIPIVAVTANAINGDREKCLALGMNDYLAKPLQPAELKRALARWLKPAPQE